MPKKRSVEVRLAEARERMERIELEAKIKELKSKLPVRRRRRGSR